MAHFFVITRGSKFHAHAVHFFVDIYNYTVAGIERYARF